LGVSVPDVDDADAEAVRRPDREFARLVLGDELMPEADDSVVGVTRADWTCSRPSVVQGDDPAVPNERAVHFEVASHALVRVVAVDEEEVDLGSVEYFAYRFERALGVRVAGEQQVETLVSPCERPPRELER